MGCVLQPELKSSEEWEVFPCHRPKAESADWCCLVHIVINKGSSTVALSTKWRIQPDSVLLGSTKVKISHDSGYKTWLDTHICAILGQRSIGLLPDLLSVHLGGTAVILGVGVICGAAMLAEERRLQAEGESELLNHITEICANNTSLLNILFLISFN